MRPVHGTVTVVGRSMWPLIQEGDRITIQPLAGLPPLGTVLVYAAKDRLVVHRLVRVQRRGGDVQLVTKGDLSRRYDSPIEPERVLGRAIRAERLNRSIPIDHVLFRAVGWLLATAAPRLLVACSPMAVIQQISTGRRSKRRQTEKVAP